MARLNPVVIERAEKLAHRIVDVADELEAQHRSRRVIDQLIGCGTSVAANANEADEAMSRADFRRALAISVRELAEAGFWLRFVVERGWIAPARLEVLKAEVAGLRRVFGSMIARVRRRDSER